MIGSLDIPENCELARVTAVHKESYNITNGAWQTRADVAGKIMFTADSPLDYPTVGDWCAVQFLGADSTSIIHEIFPRKSILKEKLQERRLSFKRLLQISILHLSFNHSTMILVFADSSAIWL